MGADLVTAPHDMTHFSVLFGKQAEGLKVGAPGWALGSAWAGLSPKESKGVGQAKQACGSEGAVRESVPLGEDPHS